MLTHVDVYSLNSQHYFGENKGKGGKWRELEGNREQEEEQKLRQKTNKQYLPTCMNERQTTLLILHFFKVKASFPRLNE